MTVHVRSDDFGCVYVAGGIIMKLIDMHCDTLTEIMAHPEAGTMMENSLSVDISRLRSHDQAVQFFACFVHLDKFKLPEDGSGVLSRPGSPLASPWDLDAAYDYTCRVLDFFDESMKTYARSVIPVRTVGDMELCINDGNVSGGRQAAPTGALLTVEEGGMLDSKIDRLTHFFEKGVRLLTLTWNYDNCIGHPNSKNEKRMALGLTPFGFQVIEQMSELGMIVDVSHLSDGGFWDVAKTAKKPFVASHSNSRAICDHPRNLTDDMLKALADSGGVAGLNFCPMFLDAENGCTVEAMIRHIEHMIHVAGEDVVAIGTDFDGIRGNLEIPHTGKLRMLYEALEKTMMPARIIEKIFYGNAQRVMKEVLPEH